ncbi:helix-turn-helix transcriptional regulator [uncultured Psychrosphaera sp.]|uniref:helix-turn-helix domain-containing protein n=1 Tax=uncultured Psychrosphaera sp. TaxID=1403522 RepID=UPI002627D703|nr:helix-turn-helix transcriptional regulator [uncultured Psychrosphaera sp.]
MSQIQQITSTLKQLLRDKKITYKKIAEKLELSEANIKRIFAKDSFTLNRLEQICNIIGIELSDLFLLSEKQKKQLQHLTEEQEQELMENPQLLLLAICVIDGWTYNEIISYYDIDEFKAVQLMAKLDRLNIIQLLPENHYKLLIAQDFRWRKNGPLEKYMETEVMTKFMNSKFNEEGSFRFYLRGRYSESSIETIKLKLNQLTKEVAVMNQEDSALPLSSRKHMGLLFAMRPWEPSLFEKMRRDT